MRDVDLQNGIRIREGDHQFLMALRRFAGWFIDLADRTTVRNAAVVLANGEHVARWIERVYGVRTEICAAGCHPVPASQRRYEVRWSGTLRVNGFKVEKPYILLTNRHSPMKRFEYAIWAMKWILRQNPRVSLVITGQETEYTDQLRYLVDGLRIEKNVKFVGLVPERDLGTLYQNAAAYVYPSPEEDFGMGIIEAMAAGTPVVAWKNGGPTVTVKDRETGFLIEPYDSDQFAERLLLLVNSPSLVEQLGKAAHRRAVERFSYEQHCRIIAESAMAALKGSQGLELAEVVVAPRVKWPEK
jgi:glycosyltransferase involved in cell wall biosynthesis